VKQHIIIHPFYTFCQRKMTHTARAPLIGITTHSPTAPDWAELGLLRDMIVRSVEAAGGLPVIMPLGLDAATLQALLGRLDGVLLAGGGDVDPARYGAEPHPTVGGVDPLRDAAEITVARWAVAEATPLFGICRGAQVLNVALGGTLYRDIAEHPGAQPHTYYPDLPLDLRPHPVQITEASRLAAAIGQPLVDVNSLHHQAVRRLAPALRAVAHAPDGLIEAVEVADHPFALAVQWHPECLPHVPEMRRLFEAFITAAAKA
jgi:putative glutamine amidotransferase